jgi:hypothetical protein
MSSADFNRHQQEKRQRKIPDRQTNYRVANRPRVAIRLHTPHHANDYRRTSLDDQDIRVVAMVCDFVGIEARRCAPGFFR